MRISDWSSDVCSSDLDALVELLPGEDEGWLGLLDVLGWQADWVVDHRADAHAVVGIRAMRALDAMLAGSPDPGRRAAVKFRLKSYLAWGSGHPTEAKRAEERRVGKECVSPCSS